MVKYRATVKSTEMMLGGTYTHASALFQSRENAEAWAKTIIEGNRSRPGRAGQQFEVEITERAPNPRPGDRVTADEIRYWQENPPRILK